MSAWNSRSGALPTNSKPFTDVTAQVNLLEGRGLSFADKNKAEGFLLRENYYAVVNGYKDIFIDRQATNLAHDDRYIQGTAFEDLMSIYTFDKSLRAETIRVLLDAEACMKTGTIYAFCDVHREADDYLDPACYCSKSAYSNPSYYTRGLIRLLSTLQAIRDNRPHKPYIKHYVDTYHCLPLWVASKCLTFGTMSAFYDFQEQNFQEQKVKTKTCVAMAKALGFGAVRQKQLEFAYHTLPDFRNICAHDERFYCAKVGKNNDRGFSEMMRALKTVTTTERLSDYARAVDAMLDDLASKNPSLEAKVLSGMGVARADVTSLIVP